MPMSRSLLLWGLAAGLLAGLAASFVAFLGAEPRIDEAIALEQAAAPAVPAGEAPVSRDGQRAGLVLAWELAGLSVGFLFALVFALLLGRVGPRRPRHLAWALGGGCFVVLALIPALKYPASPPGVGDPATIEPRTLWYVTLLVCSALAALATVRAWRWARSRWPAARAGALAAAVGLATVAIAFVLLPGVDGAPAGYPSDLLWEFRAAALASQLALWTALALAYGWLAERALAGGRGRTA